MISPTSQSAVTASGDMKSQRLPLCLSPTQLGTPPAAGPRPPSCIDRPRDRDRLIYIAPINSKESLSASVACSLYCNRFFRLSTWLSIRRRCLRHGDVAAAAEASRRSVCGGMRRCGQRAGKPHAFTSTLRSLARSHVIATAAATFVASALISLPVR